jgi:hypothetical protein
MVVSAMVSLFCQPLTAMGRQIRWGILGFALVPIAAIFAYHQGLDLPIRCLFQATFGIPGPGCGLTRSWLALLRGDWQQSFSYHLFGPMLFGICWIAGVQAGVELGRGRSLISPTGKPLATLYTRLLLHPRFLPIVFLLLLSYYGLRLYVRYDGPIPFSLDQLPFWPELITGAKLL